MAIITLNKAEVKKITGNMDDDRLNDELSLFGAGVERISEKEIDAEITPNRPDMLSQSGIYRALRYYYGKKVKNYKLNKPEKNYTVKIDKNLKEIRPFTACAIVKNLKFNNEKIKEIIDIQEKLHSTLGRNRKKIAIGIYPLEKISLPISFEARKPEDIKFIPLESDKEMNGRQILSQHPAGRDYAHLLEGKNKFPVFVDAKGEILSMPPIINSQETGKITQETKEIFIECSGFDFEILKKTLNILATMLADMNGKVYSMVLDYEGKKYTTPDFNPEIFNIEISNVNKLLGLNLKEQEIKKLLERMGYDYSKGKVFVAPYRTDIMHEVDIIEDIAIAYGYENFIPEIPEIATTGEISRNEEIKNKISEILVGLGFLELSTLHLLTKEDIEKYKAKSRIEIEKSKSDYKFLRPDLASSAMKILSENTDLEYPQKIFEIGTAFNKDEKAETGIKESEKLIIAIAPGNFTDLKQALEYLERMAEISCSIKEAEDSRFIEGRTGSIIFDNKEIGVIGEIHPSILKEWNIKMPLAVLELDLEEIFKKPS